MHWTHFSPILYVFAGLFLKKLTESHLLTLNGSYQSVPIEQCYQDPVEVGMSQHLNLPSIFQSTLLYHQHTLIFYYDECNCQYHLPRQEIGEDPDNFLVEHQISWVLGNSIFHRQQQLQNA